MTPRPEDLSYKSDPALRQLCIDRCADHKAQDRFIAGTYGKVENGKFRGCHVGCHAYDIAREREGDAFDLLKFDGEQHDLVADYYGLPPWLIHLEDSIFEGLPEQRRLDWPGQLAEAIPAGKDLTPVYHGLMVHIQTNMLPKYFDGSKYPEVGQAIAHMASLHARAAQGDSVSEDEWSAAESAAWSARSAAESAAWSARSSALSAAWAAWSAARSAAESEADAARSAAWSEIADTTLRLLTELGETA